MPALCGTLRLPADLVADFLLEVEVGVVDCIPGACGASARSPPTFFVPVTGAAVPVEVEGAVWAWLRVATPRRAESKSVVFIGNRKKLVS
jgi:hypothetical protein